MIAYVHMYVMMMIMFKNLAYYVQYYMLKNKNCAQYIILNYMQVCVSKSLPTGITILGQLLH